MKTLAKTLLIVSAIALPAMGYAEADHHKEQGKAQQMEQCTKGEQCPMVDKMGKMQGGMGSMMKDMQMMQGDMGGMMGMMNAPEMKKKMQGMQENMGGMMQNMQQMHDMMGNMKGMMMGGSEATGTDKDNSKHNH